MTKSAQIFLLQREYLGPWLASPVAMFSGGVRRDILPRLVKEKLSLQSQAEFIIALVAETQNFVSAFYFTRNIRKRIQVSYFVK